MQPIRPPSRQVCVRFFFRTTHLQTDSGISLNPPRECFGPHAFGALFPIPRPLVLSSRYFTYSFFSQLLGLCFEFTSSSQGSFRIVFLRVFGAPFAIPRLLVLSSRCSVLEYFMYSFLQPSSGPIPMHCFGPWPPTGTDLRTQDGLRWLSEFSCLSFWTWSVELLYRWPRTNPRFKHGGGQALGRLPDTIKASGIRDMHRTRYKKHGT